MAQRYTTSAPSRSPRSKPRASASPGRSCARRWSDWSWARAPATIHLKLENLQPINSFKLRGAANAVAMLPEATRADGVWTISAGNAGQGVAYAARQAGVPCTVVDDRDRARRRSSSACARSARRS